MLKPNDVFTPGQLPIRPGNVYAPRGTAEGDFRKALRRGMLPLVFGEYGVGKTSMARFSFLDEEKLGRLVNIESVADKTLDEVLSRCLEKIGYRIERKRATQRGRSETMERGAEAGVEAGGFKAVVASKRVSGTSAEETVEEELVVTSPTDSRIIELCEEHRIVLLLDEVHRASPGFADDLTKFLKAYANANCQHFRIALLGTSSDASRLVRRDPGIDRLIQEIRLRAMSEEESRYVVDKGMHDLNIVITPEVADQLVRISVGSPSILQYLCLEVAEAAFERVGRVATSEDVGVALKEFVDKRAARLYAAYMTGIETVGGLRYRKQVLRAMSEADDEFVTMEEIRTRVSGYLERDVPSTALSGPLRELKEAKYGRLLSDVERPGGDGRVLNYTTFSDPSMKSFIRMQVLREQELD